jgi:hypothetical protein
MERVKNGLAIANQLATNAAVVGRYNFSHMQGEHQRSTWASTKLSMQVGASPKFSVSDEQRIWWESFVLNRRKGKPVVKSFCPCQFWGLLNEQYIKVKFHSSYILFFSTLNFYSDEVLHNFFYQITWGVTLLFKTEMFLCIYTVKSILSRVLVTTTIRRI